MSVIVDTFGIRCGAGETVLETTAELFMIAIGDFVQYTLFVGWPLLVCGALVLLELDEIDSESVTEIAVLIDIWLIFLGRILTTSLFSSPLRRRDL